MSSPPADRHGPHLFLVLLALAAFVALVGGTAHLEPARASGEPARVAAPAAPARSDGAVGDARPAPGATLPAPTPTATPTPAPAPTDGAVLPGGGTRIFADHHLLVAYYGTAGSGALGVLGEAGPEQIVPRLLRAAAPFGRTGRTVQPVFELITTVAHAGPTAAGTYSSNIRAAQVRQYIEAAHRHGILVVLDLQPGRADFLDVAKTWAWALKDPWVGLALDPEWRMGPHGVPGRRIGSVGAAEVNRVSAWLEDLTVRNGLPEKVFMLHQFRPEMIRHVERVADRPHLALVQHVDGFGTPSEKMATFRRVVRPQQFALGFKLFYDEDVRRMRPAQVLAIRPRVSFVSFQ
jgi:hypothetical protein